MTHFETRLKAGVAGRLIQFPFIAAGASLMGYIYAKFAHLPPSRVAKTFAIWMIAETAFIQIANSFTENFLNRAVIHAFVLVISTKIGIQELQKRSLVGQKMILFLLAVRTLGVLRVFADLLLDHSNPKKDTEFESISE